MPSGRYAPSPTGTLHLGNLRTAVAAYLFARATSSEFLLRWDDLDATADRRHEAGQLADLTALGLEFDGTPLHQSSRVDAYREVVSDLRRQGLTYPCWCSRREIREATIAPHGTPGSYPGTCRDLTSAATSAHEESGRPPAVRLRTDRREVEIVDSLRGPQRHRMDDIVLQRGDGTPAYNLAVVIDDDWQGVAEVVRGDDLLESTPRHAYLQRLLGLREPTWTHVPLVVDDAGDRLSKRDGSTGLEAWQTAGGTVGGLVAACGQTLGIAVGPEATIQELVAQFDPAAVPLRPTRYRADGPELSLAN
jgi:glutamyl-tRNA synthetase